MNTQATTNPQFFMTAPAPCPYLSDQTERKVFTHLVGQRAPEMNDILTQGGFRRSQNIAYRPACEKCHACVSVRIAVDRFEPTRSMNRVVRANRRVTVKELPAEPTSEQYSLFRNYLDTRHPDGGMSDMSALDFSMMVEDTHVHTRLFEYRIQEEGGPAGGKLVATALTDVLADGLSMVYSFFDPAYEHLSFGTYMILDHIRMARKRGLPHVYLGYWVKGSQKMSYKTKFLPQEHLLANGWTLYQPD